jgi:LysM repeat protein
MRFSTSVLITGFTLVAIGCSTTNQNPIYQQTTKYKGSVPVSQSAQATIQQAGYQTQTQAPVPITYAPAQTQYQNQASYTQVNQECLSKETDRKIIGTVAGGAIGALAGRKLAGDSKTLGTVAGAAIGGAAGYGIADKTIRCDPITVPATQMQQSATITPVYQPTTQPTTQSTTAATYTAAPETTTYQSLRSETAIQETVEAPGTEGTPGYYAVNGTADYVSAPEPVRIYAAPQPIASAPTMASTSRGNTRHTLVDGDTVYSLARGACVSVSEFKQLNNIDDQYYIRAGDQILLPASRCTQ